MSFIILYRCQFFIIKIILFFNSNGIFVLFLSNQSLFLCFWKPIIVSAISDSALINWSQSSPLIDWVLSLTLACRALFFVLLFSALTSYFLRNLTGLHLHYHPIFRFTLDNSSPWSVQHFADHSTVVVWKSDAFHHRTFKAKPHLVEFGTRDFQANWTLAPS